MGKEIMGKTPISDVVFVAKAMFWQDNVMLRVLRIESWGDVDRETSSRVAGLPFSARFAKISHV